MTRFLKSVPATTNTSTKSRTGDRDLLAPQKEAPVATTNPYILYDESGAKPVFGTHKIVKGGDGRSTEVVYALPLEANNNKHEIKGIALLLHGCSHSALKFFSKDASVCPTCIGLSEELRIANILLQQQTLAVMAVTSQDRSRGCWAGNDTPHIQDALQYLCRDVLLLSDARTTVLPVLAFGASSGGRFAAQLAVGQQQIVDAAMVGVMSLGPNLVEQWNNLDDTKKPPIYLAPMPRDKGTTASATQDYESMAHGKTTAGDKNAHYAGTNPVLLDTTTCVPFPVTASLLHKHVPHMTVLMADMIVKALVVRGHLESGVSSGYLLKDPTKTNWRNILKAQCESQGCLVNQPLGPGISPLAKALHRAWAYHEYCSEATTNALEFFQRELGGGSQFVNPDFVALERTGQV